MFLHAFGRCLGALGGLIYGLDSGAVFLDAVMKKRLLLI